MTQRGRKPIGDRALTAAERQQRCRNNLKAALPPAGSEDRFRLELYEWIVGQSYFYKLDMRQVCRALEQLSTALGIMAQHAIKGEEAEHSAITNEYLTRTGFFGSDIVGIARAAKRCLK